MNWFRYERDLRQEKVKEYSNLRLNLRLPFCFMVKLKSAEAATKGILQKGCS